MIAGMFLEKDEVKRAEETPQALRLTLVFPSKRSRKCATRPMGEVYDVKCDRARGLRPQSLLTFEYDTSSIAEGV